MASLDSESFQRRKNQKSLTFKVPEIKPIHFGKFANPALSTIQEQEHNRQQALSESDSSSDKYGASREGDLQNIVIIFQREIKIFIRTLIFRKLAFQTIVQWGNKDYYFFISKNDLCKPLPFNASQTINSPELSLTKQRTQKKLQLDNLNSKPTFNLEAPQYSNFREFYKNQFSTMNKNRKNLHSFLLTQYYESINPNVKQRNEPAITGEHPLMPRCPQTINHVRNVEEYETKKQQYDQQLLQLPSESALPSKDIQKKQMQNMFDHFIISSQTGTPGQKSNKQLSSKKKTIFVPEEDAKTFAFYGGLKRERKFEIKKIDRSNLFEGLPFIQFEAFIWRDRAMQNLVIHDLLKILQEKALTFKKQFCDYSQMPKIFKSWSSTAQSQFNQNVEEAIAILSEIKFASNPEKIGISTAQLRDVLLNYGSQVSLSNELEVLNGNMKIYSQQFDYTNNCIETYSVLQRNGANKKQFNDSECHKLFKIITLGRYLLGSLGEMIRVKSIALRVKAVVIQEAKDKEKKVKEKKNEDKTQKSNFPVRVEVLTHYLQSKFSAKRNKFLTREAKVNLNQERMEKELALNMAKVDEIEQVIGDSRNYFFAKLVENPFQTPEIKLALKIAKSSTTIPIPEDLMKEYFK